MYLSLNAPPPPDFDRPLDLLKDCHRRIERFLDVLHRLAQRAEEPLGEERRSALEQVQRYFTSAGRRHTQDEEDSLFPRLRRIEDGEADSVLARLEADHRRVEAVHAQVDALLRVWLERGALEGADAGAMRALVDQLIAMYAEHIQIEDQQAFPLASRLLSNEELTAIGEEMRRRRELNPGRAGSRCAQRRDQMFNSR